MFGVLPVVLLAVLTTLSSLSLSDNPTSTTNAPKIVVTSVTPVTLITPVTPTPTPSQISVVRSQQPGRTEASNAAYLAPESCHGCTTPIYDCCTNYQPRHDLHSLMQDHPTIVPTMVCAPPCWPIVAAIVLTDYLCTPPMPNGVLFNHPIRCCQPLRVISGNSIGTLARELSLALQRTVRVSDIILLWLSQSLQVNSIIENYNLQPQPPSNQLLAALVSGIETLLASSVSHSQEQLYTESIVTVLSSFNGLTRGHNRGAEITDIVTVFIFPDAYNLTFAYHQTQNHLYRLNLQTQQESKSDKISTTPTSVSLSRLTGISTPQLIMVIQIFIRR